MFLRCCICNISLFVPSSFMNMSSMPLTSVISTAKFLIRSITGSKLLMSSFVAHTISFMFSMISEVFDIILSTSAFDSSDKPVAFFFSTAAYSDILLRVEPISSCRFSAIVFLSRYTFSSWFTRYLYKA